MRTRNLQAHNLLSCPQIRKAHAPSAFRRFAAHMSARMDSFLLMYFDTWSLSRIRWERNPGYFLKERAELVA